MGSHDLLGTRFYLGLMNIFFVGWFGLGSIFCFFFFFLSRYFCMIGLGLNFIVKIS